MCFCVHRLVCVCILVGCMLKCGCCNKHGHNSSHLRSYDKPDPALTDDLIFLKQIFHKYGSNGTLNFEGLQNLLHNLGLAHVFASHISHKEHDHKHSEEHENDHELTDPQPRAGQEEETEENGDQASSNAAKENEFLELLSNLSSSEENLNVETDHKCMSATSLMYKLQKASGKLEMNSSDFMFLCPAIIYDLDQGKSCWKESHHRHHFEKNEVVGNEVWLFASVAVMAISLCGLCSVALVPLVQRVFYQSVLQFLVGLAVGSLSGDSLLHLLPHAMAGLNHHDHQGSSSHGEEAHNETEAHMWRGLVALVGIYAFYLAERLLTRASSCYRKKSKDTRKDSLQKTSSIRRSDKSLRSGQPIHKLDPEQSRTVGEKLSHHKHGSYGFKFDEHEMEDLQKLNDVPQDELRPKSEQPLVAASGDIETINEASLLNASDSEDKLKSVASSSGAKPEDGSANETLVLKNGNNERSSFVVAVHGGGQHHHHHHHHHHSHYSPSNISTVAWMVIMGDGLHNFCDGLAIGAAFATGLSSGLSTTIAVFCHELPHELGDFAMLLKAGMSVKQALVYNALSSILCFFGMLVGVLLGNVGHATLWIFAGAAGMFLYIALVDMLPELTDQEEQGGSTTCPTLFLQILGIVMGIGIMLLIAIYEHDLRHLIS